VEELGQELAPVEPQGQPIDVSGATHGEDEQNDSVAQLTREIGLDDDAPVALANGFHVDTESPAREDAESLDRDGDAPLSTEDDDERVSN
jgi:segregation and condensation protein B